MQGLWHNLNNETGEEEEFIIDLKDDNNWNELYDKIRHANTWWYYRKT